MKMYKKHGREWNFSTFLRDYTLVVFTFSTRAEEWIRSPESVCKTNPDTSDILRTIETHQWNYKVFLYLLYMNREQERKGLSFTCFKKWTNDALYDHRGLLKTNENHMCLFFAFLVNKKIHSVFLTWIMTLVTGNWLLFPSPRVTFWPLNKLV